MRGFLVLWAGALSLVVMTLAVGHWYTLPVPDVHSPALTDALARLALRKPEAPFRALHVLYAECRCSMRVFDHLLQRGARPGVHEVVLLVGAAPHFHGAAPERGFDVIQLADGARLADYGVQAAPLFVVADRAGQVQYAGGYTERKQGLQMQDQRILDALLERPRDASAGLRGLPLFGCAVSQSLQELIDPLRIKYAQKERN